MLVPALDDCHDVFHYAVKTNFVEVLLVFVPESAN